MAWRLLQHSIVSLPIKAGDQEQCHAVARDSLAPPRARSRRGQVLVITTLGLVAVIGCVALAVDVGTLWTQRREMQAAADAAAVAGDLEIYSGNASDSDTAPITTAAQTDSAKNGFTNGANGATVTVNAPPQSGPYTGDQLRSK